MVLKDTIANSIISLEETIETLNEGEGEESVQIGARANASGSKTVSIGADSLAIYSGSVALGVSASAEQHGSIAIGSGSSIYNDYRYWYGGSIAIGEKARASNMAAIGIGCDAHGGQNGIAIGSGSNASYGAGIGVSSYANQYSVSIGNDSRAEGFYSVSVGQYSKASDGSGVAIGYNSAIGAEYSVGVGYSTKIGRFSINSIAVGRGATVGTSDFQYSTGSIAIGAQSTIANRAPLNTLLGTQSAIMTGSAYSIVLGPRSQVSGSNSIVIGNNLTSSKDNQGILGNAAIQWEVPGSMFVSGALSTIDPVNPENVATKGYVDSAAPDRIVGTNSFGETMLGVGQDATGLFSRVILGRVSGSVFLQSQSPDNSSGAGFIGWYEGSAGNNAWHDGYFRWSTGTAEMGSNHRTSPGGSYVRCEYWNGGRVTFYTQKGGSIELVPGASSATPSERSLPSGVNSIVHGIHIAKEAYDELANYDWSEYPAVQDVDLNTFKITNLADPTNPQDAATKAYVDANSGGGGPTDRIESPSGGAFAEAMDDFAGAGLRASVMGVESNGTAAHVFTYAYPGGNASAAAVSVGPVDDTGGGAGFTAIYDAASDAYSLRILGAPLHVEEPVESYHAATKAYVDSQFGGGGSPFKMSYTTWDFSPDLSSNVHIGPPYAYVYWGWNEFSASPWRPEDYYWASQEAYHVVFMTRFDFLPENPGATELVFEIPYDTYADAGTPTGVMPYYPRQLAITAIDQDSVILPAAATYYMDYNSDTDTYTVSLRIKMDVATAKQSVYISINTQFITEPI